MRHLFKMMSYTHPQVYKTCNIYYSPNKKGNIPKLFFSLQ